MKGLVGVQHQRQRAPRPDAPHTGRQHGIVTQEVAHHRLYHRIHQRLFEGPALGQQEFLPVHGIERVHVRRAHFQVRRLPARLFRDLDNALFQLGGEPRRSGQFRRNDRKAQSLDLGNVVFQAQRPGGGERLTSRRC